MKNSLLILGIALVSFTDVCNAKNNESNVTNSFPVGVFNDDSRVISSKGEAILAKPDVNEEVEEFNPDTIIPFSSKTVKETIAEGDKIIENTVLNDLEYMFYEESMKEIVAQGDLIIENTVSNETYPLFNERTIEEEITALEMIIESKETNEISPLDFKKINSNAKMTTSFNSNKFIGMN